MTKLYIMPELPEVETIKRQLNLTVAGKKIQRAEVLLPKIVKLPTAHFKKTIQGTIIKHVARRAKILVFELNNGWSVLFHLKMTGQLIFDGSKNRQTHVIFWLSGGHHLLFNDLRQFGYIKLVKTDELSAFFKKESLGPEPLPKEFTSARFMAVLDRKPRARIKQFLMDPKNIAGIGNIYSDEILFAAKVHPVRKIIDLKPSEIKAIFKNIKKILPEAIALKGTSAENYLDAYGRQGDYMKRLKVYGREGAKCPKCKGKIKRIKIGGRSAHFCPKCQK